MNILTIFFPKWGNFPRGELSEGGNFKQGGNFLFNLEGIFLGGICFGGNFPVTVTESLHVGYLLGFFSLHVEWVFRLESISK